MYNGHMQRDFLPLEKRDGGDEDADGAEAPSGQRLLGRIVSCKVQRHT